MKTLLEWNEWHREYDVVPSLQARLRSVREQIVTALDDSPPGPIRVISVCAGDGRDLTGALATHPRRNDVSATLLDTHWDSLERGRAAAAAAGLERQLQFVLADATRASSYVGAVPANLVLLSGFLGHLKHADVPRLITSLPMLCRPGAWVIWNRHLVLNAGGRQVPAIRDLFRQNAFAEAYFEATASDGFAVGRVRFTGTPEALDPARRLFEFVGLDRLEAVAAENSIEQPGAEDTDKAAGDLVPEVEMSIPARFEQIVAQHGTGKAIGAGTWQPTYDDLNTAANSLAQDLVGAGGGQGDRVALLFRQDGALIAAMLAVLKAGRVVVVLNATDPPARLQEILADAEAAALVTDAMHQALAREIAVASESVIVFDPKARRESPAPDLTIDGRDLAFLVYTSGSTGRAKGVMQTHRNILHNVRRHTAGMRLEARDAIALLASPSGGQGMATTWCALLNGATLCPFPTAELGVSQLAGWLREADISVYVSSVSVLRGFVRTLTPTDRFPRIRLVRFASEAATADDLTACRAHFSDDCVVLNTFSSSETGNLTRAEFTLHRQVAPGRLPIGKPVEGMRIALCDEQGNEVRPGLTGEMVVRSRYLSPGYWRNEALTAARFPGDTDPLACRAFHTGDLARRDADGTLVFLGRKDHQVKVNGYRVELIEIEDALLKQGEVAEALVCLREARPGEAPQLVAYVRLRPGGQTSADTLRRALRASLPPYMVPGSFVFLERFPLTPHGKVDRAVLPPPPPVRSSISHAERPRDIVEKNLSWIWQAVLGIPSIGRQDDFFELGGTSLQAVEVLMQIADKFGAVLPPSTLAEHSTIARLAPLLAEHVVLASPSPLVVLRTAATGRPLFLVHSGQGDVTTYSLMVRRLKPRPVFGLQSIGLQGEGWPLTRIETMAERYVREVIAQDPTGPYLLAGTCMGGIVAFEMAQQLVRAGRPVALLALLDVPHPFPAWWHPDWREKWFGSVRDPIRDAARMLRWTVVRGLGGGRTQRGLTEYRHFVGNMNSLANRRYRPRPYPGTLTLFTTADTRYDGGDRRLMMRRHARATRIITLPGVRRGLFARPVVDELAAKLQVCLEEAEGKS